mgnify:CR=1 FL=1
MKTDILQTILAQKRTEVEQQKAAVPLTALLALANEAMEQPTRSMRQALESSASGIIAEFKRKSPSKGWLHPNAQVAEIVPSYEANGASACSVLTDTSFFGGALGDLHKARRLVDMPLLRKDFMVDPYQLYQARALGADAILLIAAAFARILLELHQADELEYVTPEIDMLGVNNRNLGTFRTDVQNSVKMAESIAAYLKKHPDCSPLLVAESGISQPETVSQLRKTGFRGFLIGETFMKTGNPGGTLSEFIKQI